MSDTDQIPPEYTCDGEVCLKLSQMEAWKREMDKSDGSYPDPIERTPCDTCLRSL